MKGTQVTSDPSPPTVGYPSAPFGRIRRANDGAARPEGVFAVARRRPGCVSGCRVYLPSILCYALLRSVKQGRIQLHGGRGPDKSSLLFQSPHRWRRRGAPLFLLTLAHPWRRVSAGATTAPAALCRTRRAPAAASGARLRGRRPPRTPSLTAAVALFIEFVIFWQKRPWIRGCRNNFWQ